MRQAVERQLERAKIRLDAMHANLERVAQDSKGTAALVEAAAAAGLDAARAEVERLARKKAEVDRLRRLRVLPEADSEEAETAVKKGMAALREAEARLAL